MSIDFNQKKFIREVREFIEKNDISQRKFAELSNTSPMTLHRAGKGEFDLKINTILKMERAMVKFMAEIE